MKNSQVKNILNKALRIFLRSLLAMIVIILVTATPIIFLDYSFTLPKFVTEYFSNKINNALSGEKVEISDIIIKKEKNKILISSAQIESFNDKQEKIFQTAPIYFSIDIENITKHIDISLNVEKIDINTDLLEIKTHEDGKQTDDLHLYIQNKLKLGYLRITNVDFDNISLKRDTAIHNFSLFYKKAGLVHDLSISHHDQKLAKFEIEASAQDDVTYINGKIEKFPIWSLITFLPKNFHTNLSENLSEKFLVDGHLKYQMKDKKPNLKFTLNQIKNQDLSINGFDIILSNHGKYNSIFFDKIQIDTNDGGSISSKGHITTNTKLISKNTSLFFDISVSNLDTKYISYFWPQGAVPETRNWVVKSFKNGNIHQAKVKIDFKDVNKIKKDNFYAYIDFNSLELDYFEEHKSLTDLSGTANFDLDKVTISVDNGKLNSADIEKSLVEIEYGIKGSPMTIKTNAQGNVSDFIDLMGKTNKNQLIDYGVNLNQSSGNLRCSVFLNFPLTEKFSLDKAKINVKADIDAFQTSLFEKVNITDGDLRLVLTNENMYIKGPLNINNQKSNFEFISNLDKKKASFRNKLNIDSQIESNSNFEEILNNKFRILDGNALLNIHFLEKENIKTLSVHADLDNAEFYVPALGITKNKDINSNLSFEIENVKNSNWISKQFSFISGDGINLNGQFSADHNFDEVHYLSLKLQYPETDLDIDYTNENNLKKISITGPELNLENAHISEIFSNNSFSYAPSAPKKEPATKNLEIVTDIKTAKMNNGVYFKNIVGKFECKGLECSQSELTIDIDEKAKLTVTRTLDEKKKPNWTLKTTNASKLLTGLGLYHDILGGELSIRMWNANNKSVLMDNNSVFVGEMKMANFKVIKNPIITKLVSFTSIMGILNIFTDMNQIPFSSADGHFVFANNVLRLNRFAFAGSYLTASLHGTVDWNYNDIDLYGKVIPPVYGFNAILAYIPFIGHKTADGKSKGLIAADYSITGKIGDTSVFINPLAILFPEFIYLFA